MSKAQTKRKNQRLPGAPQKPLSAYMLFCADRRPTIIKNHPDIKFVDIAKMMGSQWKNLDEETQKEYQEKAKNEKQRYIEEWERYKNGERFPDKKQKKQKQEPESESEPEPEPEPESESGSESESEQTQESNLERDNQRQSGAPMKPLSAYMLFCADIRPSVMKKHPGIEITEIGKIMGAQWNQLDAKTQEKYRAKAEDDKQRYINEYKRYQDGERFPNKKQKQKQKQESDSDSSDSSESE